MVRKTTARYNQMQRTLVYKNLVEQHRQTEANTPERKSVNAQLNELRQKYRLSEFAFHSEIKDFQAYYPRNVNSIVAQKLATSLWQAFEKVLYSDGEKIHFKRKTEFSSIEGKNNTTGIRFKNGIVDYGPGLSIHLRPKLNPKNLYEQRALQNRVKYCRIKRKCVRGKWKYYVQLIMEGYAPIKTDENGVPKHYIGFGRVGIDIGTQTVAVVSQSNASLLELADRVQNIENELRLVNRAMDRSRRATNPQYFNANDTIKKIPKSERRHWNNSGHYSALAAKRRELCRKQADIRKQQHYELINGIIAQGTEVYIEDMNFNALQRRSKETKRNEKTGKIHTKKRFGKSLANKAPSMFVTMLGTKLKNVGGSLVKIDTRTAKASQYNHLSQEYNKKKLSQRWNDMPNGDKIQRDLYSAFLIMNTNATHDGFAQAICEKNYPTFVLLHNTEIQRLQSTKHPSSMGC